MRAQKRLFFSVVLMLSWLTMVAQPLCSITKYDEADGVSSAHVTQLLQDEQGFMWFSTWNGLCRYDGYEFKTFKPQAGDGCHMATDRIRNIKLLPGGRILCFVDTENYVFELSSYRFRNLVDDEKQVDSNNMEFTQSRSLLKGKQYSWTDSYQTQWIVRGDGSLTYLQDGKEIVYPLPMSIRKLAFVAPDNQGNLWATDYSSIYRFSTSMLPTQRLPIEPCAEVKCLFADSRGHYFVTTKDDQTIRVYSSDDDKLLGYLGPDGRLHHGYTPFGAAVYCMYESADGTLWLGTKPNGLFRLRPIGADAYKIEHFTDIPHQDVYHILEDRWGRLWVATLGGGVFYTTHPSAEKPHFVEPRNYPKKEGARARYFFFTKDDELLIATGNGLMVGKMERDAEKIQFRCHQREPERKKSLSCSATMNIVQDLKGRLYVSTESGGVNQIEDTDLLAPSLSFRHFNEMFHEQSNDVVQSLTATKDGGLMAIGSHLVTLIDSNAHARVLDAHFFKNNYRFSEAQPLQLRNGRWLMGLMDGACVTISGEMRQQTYQPRVALTQISIQGGISNWSAESLDTLILQPKERSLTVHFSALDYSGSDRISYAFRLSPDDEWNYIGHDRSVTLLDLEPDVYQLEICSTNSNGEWQDNIRQLTIIVKPTFWEAWYGQLLILFLIIGAVAAIVYTLLYIRRINRRHRETLEKYLALIEVSGEKSEVNGERLVEVKAEEQELDPMIKRVMVFVEENISNSDAGVGDMALAAATSRSGLQRKLKQAMGITPLDLMREARIKRACQLLRQTDKSVSEVAYACGFTDPKYFSKSFRQSIGQSPTEYRENN